jgi:NitT/TauT family transport system substrate-binding protein
MKTGMGTRYRGVLGSLAALIVVGIALAAVTGRMTPTAPQQIETLRLGAYDGDVGALEWIAKDKGFFDRAGINVVMKGYPSGNAAMEAMRAGEVDMATAADLVVAKRSFDETDLRVLADICRYWNKGIVGRRDRGIATAADLRGKRIGVPVTSSAEHNLVVFLALQGMSTRDVTVIDLPPKKIVEQMASGEIDAAIVWQPHVLAIQKQLGDTVVTLMDGGTEAHLLLVARRLSQPGQTEVTKKLLRGLVAAEDWALANPDEAKAWLRQRFSLEADYLDVLWSRMHLAVSLPQEILPAMDNEARWLARADADARLPSFADAIDSAPLIAVKPSAVRIFARQGAP